MLAERRIQSSFFPHEVEALTNFAVARFWDTQTFARRTQGSTPTSRNISFHTQRLYSTSITSASAPRLSTHSHGSYIPANSAPPPHTTLCVSWISAAFCCAALPKTSIPSNALLACLRTKSLKPMEVSQVQPASAVARPLTRPG